MRQTAAVPETTRARQLRMCWNLPSRALMALVSHGHVLSNTNGQQAMLGCGARAELDPSPLTPRLPLLSSRCTGSRMACATQQCPSSSPRSSKKSSSKAEQDRTATPSRCLKTRGGARQATGPGDSILPCCFIEGRWYWGGQVHICCSWVRMDSLSAPLVELGTGVDVSYQGT